MSMIRVLRPFYPAMAVAIIGFIVACVLAVLAFQYITAGGLAVLQIPTTEAGDTGQEAPVSEAIETTRAAIYSPAEATPSPMPQPKTRPAAIY